MSRSIKNICGLIFFVGLAVFLVGMMLQFSRIAPRLVEPIAKSVTSSVQASISKEFGGNLSQWVKSQILVAIDKQMNASKEDLVQVINTYSKENKQQLQDAIAKGIKDAAIEKMNNTDLTPEKIVNAIFEAIEEQIQTSTTSG